MGLDVFAIVLALAVLIALAFQGLPVILFAPLCAMLAVGLSGRPLLPSYTETFMTSAAGYIRSFFPLFLLGAVFGKLMETSGAAQSIAAVIARALGPRRSILAVVLACGVLTYGGVSLFVVAFAVYPFASALFRAADIPKRLIPGAIALGAFTLTMDGADDTEPHGHHEVVVALFVYQPVHRDRAARADYVEDLDAPGDVVVFHDLDRGARRQVIAAARAVRNHHAQPVKSLRFPTTGYAACR